MYRVVEAAAPAEAQGLPGFTRGRVVRGLQLQVEGYPQLVHGVPRSGRGVLRPARLGPSV